MAEIDWIKLKIDLFDNRKIKVIRKMPEGNNILLVWIFLLTQAGKCNSGGIIYLTESIPMDPQTLADLAEFDVRLINLALSTFEKLGMISISSNGYISISSWGEHQSEDRLKQIREENRLRKRKQRERQKQKELDLTGIPVSGSESHVTSCDMSRDVTTQNKKLESEEESDRESDSNIGKHAKVTGDNTVSLFEDCIKAYDFPLILTEKLHEWIIYKNDREEGYVRSAINALLKKVDELYQQYGADNICNVLDESMANCWKNPLWKLLEEDQTMPNGRNKTGSSYMESIHNRVDVVDSWI